MKKVCSKCGAEKDLAEFNKQKTGKCGVRADCRECQNKANQEYKQTEKGVQLRREWKRSDKGREGSRRYREANSEKIKEYYQTERYKEIHKESADRQRFGGNRRKALERDNYRCSICGSTERLQVHHIDETGRNKPKEIQNNELNNLITLCAKCHIEQHNPVLKRWGRKGGDAKCPQYS